MTQSLQTEAEHLPAIAGGQPAFAKRLIFQAPVITQLEIDSVLDCLRSRWIGLGPRVTTFETAFAAYTGAPYAAAVSSCSAALHLSLLALGVGPGDEVIAPSMTYCATVHAILHVGATPVLVDCDRETSNVGEEHISPAITARTKAVIIVHIAGRACEMSSIVRLCKQKNLLLIEDCAHAIETTCKGIHAGLHGNVGCFSFYPTKNITSGDGGMIITSDRRLQRRIKLLSRNGMSADAWCRETTNRRTRILAAGYKYNMTDLEASLGMAQLSAIEPRWLVRQQMFDLYQRLLQHPAILSMPASTQGDRHAYHLLAIRLRLDCISRTRDQIVEALSAENIGTGIHYVPIHRQPYYRRRYRLRDRDYPNATSVGQSTLSLPLSADMDERSVTSVCTTLVRLLNYYSSPELS